MIEVRRQRRSKLLYVAATIALLLMLSWVSPVLAESKPQTPSKNTPSTQASEVVCPSGYRCLTDAQFLEVAQTIQDLRQALHVTTLDLAAYRVPTPVSRKVSRISFGPEIGIAVLCSNGPCAGEASIGLSLQWNWWRSK